jgi:hypothetical protein
MTTDRGHLTVADLTGVVHEAFGATRTLSSIDRLRGGTKKGVYRLILDDGTTSLAYIWNDDEDYWTAGSAAGVADSTGPFAHASGVDLFEAAHRTLSAAGVRVPRMSLLDRSGTVVAGDMAVVEDLRGGSLEAMMGSDPERAGRVLARLGATVRLMHDAHRDQYGRPNDTVAVGAPTVEQLVLGRALGHLAEAARRVDRIAAVEQRLAASLHDRCAVLTPRTRFSLIHGELGPDHVYVTDDDEPVLIDIEGTFFFDAEWEHAFLELRFGDDYHHLADPGLDQDRLHFYRLAMHLALVEGPLRLLDGDFPDRALMLQIVENSIGRTLEALG